ncbi:MAG: HNH endonuclease [Flavobacteriales bacterium]
MSVIKRSEVWKDFSRPIWKFNNQYKVSRYGAVKVMKTQSKNKEVKTYILGGYETFSERKKDGKTDLIYLHRLVAELFLVPDSTRPYVIHKDYDKLNNNVENLQYVNRKELVLHNMNNPKVIESKKHNYYTPKYSKLNVGKVKMIKRQLFDPNRKTRLKMIAKRFGVTTMQLHRIKTGENWGHVTDF